LNEFFEKKPFSKLIRIKKRETKKKMGLTGD
jgi:hypothetical protein